LPPGGRQAGKEEKKKMELLLFLGLKAEAIHDTRDNNVKS
jgi:hypothetical protein